MALIWIMTVGNSDIKLKSDDGWGDLRANKREALKPCYGDFKRPTEEPNGWWSLPARVLGLVYGDALETHWNFEFPLLSTFTKEIKSDKKNKLDRIIVLLTDQTKIFLDTNPDSMYDRSDPDCPYWKDTGDLKPILKKYFENEFGNTKVQFSTLEPTDIQKGLDHWDETLHLVQQKFTEWKISKGDRVIVSHQAGTPAISSAVQLTALIEFGKKVRFLVSNEFIKDKAQFLPGSSYFSTLQIEEAQQLLSRFDYGGVIRTLEKIEFQDESKQTKLSQILELLKLADLWNSAKFDEFAKKLGDPAASRSQTFWWKGYEMAYLAWMRMYQENPTEAFFHSVRAVEGLICEWAIDKYSSHIRYKFIESDKNGNKNTRYRDQRFYAQQEGAPVAKKSIDRRFKDALEYDNQKKSLEENKLGLYGQNLYTLFRTTFESQHVSDIEAHPIKVVWEQLADERNELFHRLKGITEQEVCKAWGCKDRQHWGQLLFDCIQLVSNTQEEGFKSLKQGSLLTPIHDEIEQEIKALLGVQELV
jgi:hypothetical protein